MSRQRIEFEPAWLLSDRPYRETSRLCEALTPTHGRVGLIARGAGGLKSKLRGTLAPFRPLLLSWVETGDLGTLTGAESDGPDVALEGERIFHGWYLNELLLALLQRHDPHPQLYAVYAATLARLAGGEFEAEAALRLFEKRLLEELGYGLPLEGAWAPELRYRLDVAAGMMIAADAADSVAGSSLIALADEQLDTRAALTDARRLLRRALQPHLPPRGLRTPVLLREMRSLSAHPARIGDDA